MCPYSWLALRLQTWIVYIWRTCRTRTVPNLNAPTSSTSSIWVRSTSLVLSLMIKTVWPHTLAGPKLRLSHRDQHQLGPVILCGTHNVSMLWDTELIRMWPLQSRQLLLLLLLLHQLKLRPSSEPLWWRTQVLASTIMPPWHSPYCLLSRKLSCCVFVVLKMLSVCSTTTVVLMVTDLLASHLHPTLI